MPVQVQGDHDAGVSHERLNHLWMRALANEQRRVGVPEGVRRHAEESGTQPSLSEWLMKRAGVQHAALVTGLVDTRRMEHAPIRSKSEPVDMPSQLAGKEERH